MSGELSEEQKLALWMLARMRESEKFLSLIRQQRVAGSADALDTADRIARHAGRLAPLYQGESAQGLDVGGEVAGRMVAAQRRDLLSCPEELIEKALAAYLKKHSDGEEDLPPGWQSTLALAEAEVRGEVQGQFAPGFVALLAGRAREEQSRVGVERGRGDERERD